MALYLTLMSAAWSAMLSSVTSVIITLLVVAVAVSILQAVVQIDDMSLSFLPRLITMIAILLLGGFGAFPAIRSLQVLWLDNVAALVHQPWY